MALKRGNTYSLRMLVSLNGVPLKIDELSKVVFKLGNVKKEYPSEEVTYENDSFIIKLTQEETLNLDTLIEYEVAVKFLDDSVKRSEPKKTYSIKTIIKEVI